MYQSQGGIEADRILVRTSLVDPGGPVDHLSRLLDQGGLLYDGRLTLPRLITDPLQLWEDLQKDEEFQQQIEAFTTDCEDLWSCIAAHPVEMFGLLSRVPQIIGEATTLDEVSQVQLFVPNFVDDVIASLDGEALAELQSLLDPAEGRSSDDLEAFLQERVTAALATSGNVLQDAYLVGSYGQWPEPFDGEPFTSTLPNPDDPDAAPPFPTTPKIFGIELGSGRLSGEVTETGFDLDLVGKFLGLADVRFEVEVNTAANPFVPPAEEGTQQNTLLRAGAELVLGAAPEACTISPSAWQGAEDAEQVAEQILSFLAHVGLSDEIDETTGTIGEAFEWLNLDGLGTELGACFRAFSPGFDPDSSDPLRRSGGIEAYARLVLDNLVDADFEFQVRPSSVYPLIPNVIARGAANQVLLPGLEGLSPSGNPSPMLGSDLEISFVHEDGILSSSLGGTIVLLGQEFSLSGDTTLEIHSDGISGAISMDGSGPLGIPRLYSIGGDFTLAFDTRPGSAFAAIQVENGTLELPGFALSDATLSIRVDRNGLHVEEINGRNGLFGDLVTLDFDDSSFSISPDLQILDIDVSARGDVNVTVGPGGNTGNPLGPRASLLQPAYFEFTLDRQPDQSIGYKIRGIDFWARSSREDQPNWQLLFDADGFAEPIASSSDAATSAEQDPRVPGWTHFERPMHLQNPFCFAGPVTFRLAHSTPSGSSWDIDNMAIRGEEVVGGCAGELDTSIDEIEAFLDQQGGLLPGGFEISGPGDVSVRIIPEPGNVDPDPRDVVAIEVTGTDPSSTIITITDNGANPAPENIAPIHITTDAGVFMVDLLGAETFRGQLNIGGTVTDAIYSNSMTDGSSIFVAGQAGDELELYSSGAMGTPDGSGVDLVFGGHLSAITTAGGWFGGSIDVGSLSDAWIGGDFTGSAEIESGFGSFTVIGGDFASPSFVSGGPGEAIAATTVDGVGGSVTGVISIGGDLGTVTASGGSIDVNLSAGNVEQLLANADPDTEEGGDIAGEVNVASVDQVTSFDGDITMNLTTHDALHQDLQVDAVSRNGRGGINSRNSFHIAGGVARISGNQIRLRIEAGGEIKSIIAVPDSSGRPALLDAQVDAGRIGTITAVDADVHIELTTHDEAWQLGQTPAIGRINVRGGTWDAGRLQLSPGTTIGSMTVDGQSLDPDSPGGLVMANGYRIEPIVEGFQQQLFVIPASWQNPENRNDVNADGVVTPLDALRIINDLNRHGPRVLSRPSIRTSLPKPFVDTDGDLFVAPLDALHVINELNRQLRRGISEGNGEGETTAETATDAAIALIARSVEEDANVAVPRIALCEPQQDAGEEHRPTTFPTRHSVKPPATVQRAREAATAVFQYPLTSSDEADRIALSSWKELDAELLESLALDQTRVAVK